MIFAGATALGAARTAPPIDKGNGGVTKAAIVVVSATATAVVIVPATVKPGWRTELEGGNAATRTAAIASAPPTVARGAPTVAIVALAGAITRSRASAAAMRPSVTSTVVAQAPEAGMPLNAVAEVVEEASTAGVASRAEAEAALAEVVAAVAAAEGAGAERSQCATNVQPTCDRHAT